MWRRSMVGHEARPQAPLGSSQGALVLAPVGAEPPDQGIEPLRKAPVGGQADHHQVTAHVEVRHPMARRRDDEAGWEVPVSG